jgi:hypothetical protein
VLDYRSIGIKYVGTTVDIDFYISLSMGTTQKYQERNDPHVLWIKDQKTHQRKRLIPQLLQKLARGVDFLRQGATLVRNVVTGIGLIVDECNA